MYLFGINGLKSPDPFANFDELTVSSEATMMACCCVKMCLKTPPWHLLDSGQVSKAKLVAEVSGSVCRVEHF